MDEEIKKLDALTVEMEDLREIMKKIKRQYEMTEKQYKDKREKWKKLYAECYPYDV